ncbi:MAG: hypothetical protein M3R65_02665 [Gemmatimonadota bacterium]|nr:hypothetical protein [Gemmatimonadota bacterium]
MTTTSLHPVPSTRSVAIEQFRAVGIAVRKEAIFYICALVVIGALVTANGLHFVQTHPQANLHAGNPAQFNYGIVGVFPLILLALLYPFAVWKNEDPARRAYHWAMPIARGPHTLLKVAAGWAWLMIAVAVYLLFIIVVGALLSLIRGDAFALGTASGWEWLAAFTAPTLMFLLASIAVIGSDHAWRWIAGTYFGYWIVVGLLFAFGMPEVSQALGAIVNGTYGLNAALVGASHEGQRGLTVGVTRETMNSFRMSAWIVAMPLWALGAAVAVVLVSYRHRE